MTATATTLPPATTDDALGHTWLEDALAILVGTLLISFGVAMFKSAGLLTGSTAGLAFLVHYQTGVPFGVAFSLINLPFYWLAVKRMGWLFTLKTFVAVSLLSLFTGLHGQFAHFGGLNPFYSGLIGGLMMGLYRAVPSQSQPGRGEHSGAVRAGPLRYSRWQAAAGGGYGHPAGLAVSGERAGTAGVYSGGGGAEYGDCHESPPRPLYRHLSRAYSIKKPAIGRFFCATS